MKRYFINCILLIVLLVGCGKKEPTGPMIIDNKNQFYYGCLTTKVDTYNASADPEMTGMIQLGSYTYHYPIVKLQVQNTQGHNETSCWLGNVRITDLEPFLATSRPSTTPEAVEQVTTYFIQQRQLTNSDATVCEAVESENGYYVAVFWHKDRPKFSTVYVPKKGGQVTEIMFDYISDYEDHWYYTLMVARAMFIEIGKDAGKGAIYISDKSFETIKERLRLYSNVEYSESIAVGLTKETIKELKFK